MVTVLLLTNTLDGDNSSVIEDGLLQSGNDVLRWNVDDFTRGSSTVTFEHCESESLLNMSTSEGSCLLSPSTIDSVWFRRPYRFDFPIEDPVQRAAAEEDVRDVLSSIWYVLDECSWISAPHAIARARLKPIQLGLARQAGLAIPPTVITNNPEEAKSFCRGGDTIYKPICSNFLEYPTESYVALTTRITDEMFENLEMIRSQPVILQRWVEKQYEVRATYVDGVFFACQLTSAAFSEVVDWREPEVFEQLVYQPMILPPAIERAALHLMQMLNLRFGAIDFGVDKDGNFLFFEVNPVGQWLWIEEETSLPISDALVYALTQV